jgi:hypothetical protein
VFTTSVLLALSSLAGADITFYTVIESDVTAAGAGDVVEVPDGGYAILSDNQSWTLVRTDSFGVVLAQHCNVFGYTMCITDAGELVVAGIYSDDSVLLHWMDQMGAVNRSKSYYVIDEIPIPRRIIETSDGGYAVCGYPATGYGPEGFLLRLDDQENILWATLFDTQELICLVEIYDSEFVVGGHDYVDGLASLTWVDEEGIEGQTLLYEEGSFNGIVSTSTGYAMSRLDGSVVGVDFTGNVEWCYTSSDIEHFSDICLADNGDVVAVGHYWEEYYSGLTRLNPEDGSPVWERYYPDCCLYLLTAAADGGFAIVGVCPGLPYYDDIILIKTDSEGYCPQLGIEDGVTPGDDIGLQVCPNPCTGSTNVRFLLSEPANVELSFYDISGRQVDGEPKQTLDVGVHSISIQDLDTGLYFVRLITDGDLYVQRFAVVSD